ncbi:MAG: aminotransferase class V-fold PLP-dependent enzyme [Bryobacterales bacterium]|nr:aminotransferase class V-fold PLP-dependent enzyme [Bryobacterales bacterium]
MPTRSTRRRFVQAGAALPALAASPAMAAKQEPTLAGAGVYTRLGVRPVINAIGTVTILGGSLMPPEVVRAMDEAARFYVNVPELQEKVGARLAEVIGVPGAAVTAGAASAITLATAACLTRGDRKKMYRLPDTSDMPNEVIQPKAHISGYEAQILLTGAKIVRVETVEEMERAINPRTVMMFYVNKNEREGQISRQDFLRVGKAHNVPTFNDAAADVPPASRLSSIVKEGFDLVAFSGGKGLCGPQSSGLLLGRKDLTDAARMCISPQGGIGRGMKVNKEEMIGLLAAVERYLKLDLAAELRVLEGRVEHILTALAKVPGVKAERYVPHIANEVPHIALQWDEQEKKLTAREVIRQLLEGEPAIAVLGGNGRINVSVWKMRGNEHRSVARRLVEVFKA